MPPVGLEKLPGNEPHVREYPAEERQLKYQSHDEIECEEVVHVGVERDLVGNHFAHLVLGQESQGEGEYQKVSDGDTDEKHDVSRQKGPSGVALLAGVESRADEAPQLVDDIGESYQQGQPHGGTHVDKELGGQLYVDEFHLELVVAEIGENGHVLVKGTQPAIQHEIGVAGSQNHAVEDIGHEGEKDDGQENDGADRAQNDLAQVFDVFPKTHLFQFVAHKKYGSSADEAERRVMPPMQSHGCVRFITTGGSEAVGSIFSLLSISLYYREREGYLSPLRFRSCPF